MIASAIITYTSELMNSYDSIQLTVLGLLPQKNSTKTRQSKLINSIIQFSLPENVKFINPPADFYSNEN